MLEIFPYRTAGMEQFTAMRDLYFKNATHIMLVFSLTHPSGLDKVIEYHNLMKELKATTKILLVGTKSDLKDQRRVTKEEGQALADKIGCPYIEVSSKLNQNVTEAILELVAMGEARKIPPYIEKEGISGSTMVSDLEGLLNNNFLSDLKVICEQKSIYLHKVIVSLRFPTFLEFFDKSCVFNCTKVTYNDLMVLLRWIYTGTFVHPHPEDLKPAIIYLQLFPLLPDLSKLNESPSKTTVPSFKMIFNETALSDITLVVGNTKYPAHQQILSCRSSYFRTMFQSGFKESHASNLTITVKETLPEIFLEVLKYIYTDEVEIQEDNWQNLFNASLVFGIEGLTRMVEKFLIQNTNLDNVVLIYSFYLEYAQQLPCLYEKIRYVVGYHLPLIVNTKSFKALSKKLQQDLEEMKIEGSWRIDQPNLLPKKKENCSIQ
uniref:BTB domain-containing protein n=1 Tax=Arcella intermedia TaxID=1963864 RepID=A0A6B2L336_9EUKA